MIDHQTFRLDGRIALVTGSTSGIGLALARGLGQAGAHVVLNGRVAARVDRAVAALAAEGLRVSGRAFDVRDASWVEQALSAVEAELGPVDILVNSASLHRRTALLASLSGDWQAVLRTHVDGLVHTGQAAARRMVARRRGRIVNVCSVLAEIGRADGGAQAASQGAVRLLTQSMAIDLAPYGITVNGLAAGCFKTRYSDTLSGEPAFGAWAAQRTPTGRWGTPDELAPAVVFLASDAASFVNGHVLCVDGGLSATL